MKKVLLISALILVFAAGTALAGFGIPGMSKSNLKKEVKQLKLTDADAALKDFEGGDLDPNKVKQVEYTVFNDPDFDTFALSVAKTELILAFGNNVVTDINAKLDKAEKQEELDALKKSAEAAGASLKVIALEAPKLIDSSKKIIGDIKGKVTKDPLGYGKNAKAMYTTLEHGAEVGKNAPGQIKTMSENLIEIIGKIKTKGDELTAKAKEE